MNTVDALKDLYKTLCGKDYAGDPNPTDAEMIKAIAKDASAGGGGSGSGGGGKIVVDVTDEDNPVVTPIVPGLTMEELAKYQVVAVARQMDYIVRPTIINASEGSSVGITRVRYPENNESVLIRYVTSDSENTYIATARATYPDMVTIEFEKGVISLNDRSNTFTAAADDGQVTITVAKNQPDEMVAEGVAPLMSVIPNSSDSFNMFYATGPQMQNFFYNIVTGEVSP